MPEGYTRNGWSMMLERAAVNRKRPVEKQDFMNAELSRDELTWADLISPGLVVLAAVIAILWMVFA